MKPITSEVSLERQRVKLFTTDNWEVQGEITFPGGGYKSRLSDVINEGQPFIALTDVLIYDQSGREVARQAFVAVNKQSIKLVLEA
jgi:hypothetical protein